MVYNLPGRPHYNLSKPWVIKVQPDGHLASEIYVYVDDGRATGHNLSVCWAAVRLFASICTRLRIQDAACKRTFPTTPPGPWAGTVTHTDNEQVAGTVTQEKWAKT